MRISRTRMQTFAESSVLPEGSTSTESSPPSRREDSGNVDYALKSIKLFNILLNSKGGGTSAGLASSTPPLGIHKHVKSVLNVLEKLADIDERAIEYRSTICNVQHRLTKFER